MSTVVDKKNKIDELESIRGLAALIVVMYHIPSWNAFFHHIPLIRGGGIMVDLFFVLSGFVIYTAYGNKLTTGTEFFRFQFLRFGRLYPVHLLFLLVALAIETLKYVLQTYYGIESHTKAPFVENNFAAFVREIFLVKAFWPNETAMSFNSPAWSISAEFYTYILFALVVLFFSRLKIVIFAAIAAVSIYILFALNPENYNFMLRCWAGFFVGCLTAYALQQNKTTIRKHVSSMDIWSWMSIWAIPLTMVILVWIASTASGYSGSALWVYPVSGLLIAAITLSPENTFKQVLSHRWLVWLGTVSYSLYMSHGAVLWGYQQVIRVLFHRPEFMVNQISTPQFSPFEATILIVVFLAISLLVSQATYQLVEKPFREASRRKMNKGLLK